VRLAFARLRTLAVIALLLAPEYAWAAIPAFRAVGTFTSGTTTCAAPLPSGHTTNDILVLLVESDDSANVTEDQGYTNLGKFTCSTTLGLTIFVKRHDGSEATSNISSCVDHCHCQIAAYSGVTTGADFYQLGTDTCQATTGMTYTAITTETNDALVLLLASLDDNATDAENVSGYTNANLSSLSDRGDQTDTTGNGGGVAFADGGLATAGSTGDSTATHDGAVGSTTIHLALYSIEPSAPTCTAGLNLPLLGVGGCP
jgi:hypothetical protein